MNRFCKRAFLLMFVVGIAVLLFLLMPLSSIFEIMLIALGILCIVLGITIVDDMINLHRVRQQWREIHLRRLRQQLPPHRERR